MPTVTDQQLRTNRMIMTIVHYVLTYPRWSISLFLLLSSRSLPIPTIDEGFRQPIQAMYTVVREESQLYYECTVNGFDDINQRMVEVTSIEETRAASVRAANALLLAEWQQQADRCYNHTLTSRRAAQEWRLQNGPLPALNETCTEVDRMDLGRYLNADYEQVHEEATGLLNDYIAQSLQSLELAAAYLDERTTYDYYYFIGIKLEAALQLVHEFEIDLPLPDLDLLAEIRLELEDLRVAFLDLHGQFELMRVRLQDFYVSIDTFRIEYEKLYFRFVQLRLFVLDFLPEGTTLPDFFELSDIPTASVLLPDLFELPDFRVFPDYDLLLDDTIKRLLVLIARAVADALEEAEETAREAMLALYEKLKELSLLEDYDPPKYNGSQPGVDDLYDELSVLEKLSQATKLRMKSAVERLRGIGQSVGNVLPSTPDINVSSPEVDGNATSFEYLEPELPSWSFPELLFTLLSFLVAKQWAAEIVVQFFRLLRLKRKYEREATPDLPEIDFIREKDEEEEESKSKARMALFQQAVIRHLLTPWSFLALIILPIAIFSIFVWLPHITHSCVDTQKGTFMARRLLTPLFINKASVAGNGYHRQAERSCNRRRQAMCSSLFAESDLVQREQELALFMIESRFDESLHVVDVMDRCLDIEALDNLFETACCGLHGYDDSECPTRNGTCPIDNLHWPPSSFLPVGELLQNEACTALPLLSLEDGLFQCDELDMCNETPCSGVDQDLIRRTVIEADCKAEVYVVQCCILVLLVLYHAIVLNLCCTLVFHGFKRLRWRSLRPDGIKFRTHVNEHGELVRGSESKDRVSRIADAMRRYELVGYVQTMSGTVLFGLWFASFFVLRNKLSAYRY